MWIARDKDNSLHLFINKPSLYSDGVMFLASEPSTRCISVCSCCCGDILEISSDLYPEVTFENSPIELKLDLK